MIDLLISAYATQLSVGLVLRTLRKLLPISRETAREVNTTYTQTVECDHVTAEETQLDSRRNGTAVSEFVISLI